MAQLVESIEGLGEACRFFDVPVTGGNVSLYNETLGEAIFPSPVVGIVGLLKTGVPVSLSFQRAGASVILLGGPGDADGVRFGGTQYAKTILDSLWGLPPALDMEFEKRVQSAARRIIGEGLAESAHDVSGGGLAVALARCSFANRVGVRVELDSDLRPELLLFHEGPSRFVFSTREPERIQQIARDFGVPAPVIGVTMEEALEIRNRTTPLIACEISRLRHLWEGGLERLLSGSTS
jgi:phosphoribosylformylglycinamidine synthase